MNFDDQETIKIFDSFWGQLFEYNHKLMKCSEGKQQLDSEFFINVIDFYLTSQAQCFIKDLLTEHIGSTGMLLTARCFLEGLSLKRMYTSGKISNLQVELLRHQVYIIEYNYYKKFDDIYDKILLPEKLVKDKDNAVKFFKEKLSGDYSEKQITAITKTNAPFLCLSHVNYRKLIKENLGEKYAKFYGLYSQAIHPSVNDFYINDGVWQTVPEILYLILEEYKSLPKSQLSFRIYSNRIFTSDVAQQYKDLIRKECKILLNISQVFEKFFQKNYLSDTLMSINLLMNEMCTDKLFGLCEQVKSKWKIALDMFSSFYKCYVMDFPQKEKFMLLEEHERIQIKRNLLQNPSTDHAYNLYKSIYPNGVDRDAFDKSFQSISGYTIDKEGKTKTLTNMVKDFIGNFADSRTEISFDRAMLLEYVESQMLSHANGYMWYSNRGAWNEIDNVIIGMDYCILFLLRCILAIFTIDRTTEEIQQYKPIINVVRNGKKRIEDILEKKVKLLQSPTVSI